MSLAKIPLSILFALAFKKCYTSPNPPAKKSEVYVKAELKLPWFINGIPVWAPSLQLLASFAETAMIVAYNNPSSQLATSILAALTFDGGNAANLRITPINLSGCIMMITGTLLRIVTYHYLGRFFRFEASIQEDHQLVTEGPYSIVRHPSYTGFLLTHSGWFLWHFGPGSWVRASGLWSSIVGKLSVLSFACLVILGTLCLTLSRMTAEDEALQKRFGTQWDEWANRVSYKLVPCIY